MNATAPCFCQLCCPNWDQLDSDPSFTPQPGLAKETWLWQAAEGEPEHLLDPSRVSSRPEVLDRN